MARVGLGAFGFSFFSDGAAGECSVGAGGFDLCFSTLCVHRDTEFIAGGGKRRGEAIRLGGGYVFWGQWVGVWKRFLKIVVTVYRPIGKKARIGSQRPRDAKITQRGNPGRWAAGAPVFRHDAFSAGETAGAAFGLPK